MAAGRNVDETSLINSIIEAKSNSFIGTSAAITSLDCVLCHENAADASPATTSNKAATVPGKDSNKSFSSRRRSSAAHVDEHEEQVRKLNQSANLGPRRWYIVLGDALGFVYKLEITRIIALTASNSSIHYQSYSPHANIYTKFPRRSDIHIGLEQPEIEALDFMLKVPTGSSNTIQIQGSYGVNASADIAPLSKWYTHSEGVKSLKCVQDNRCYFNIDEHGKYYTVANQVACPMTPICIVTVNATGVLHTWGWDGDEYGGSVDSELQKQFADKNRKGWTIPRIDPHLEAAMRFYRAYSSAKVQKKRNMEVVSDAVTAEPVKRPMDYMESLIHYIIHHFNKYKKFDAHMLHLEKRHYGSDYSTVVYSDVATVVGDEDKYSKWKQSLSNNVTDDTQPVIADTTNDAQQEKLILHTLRDPVRDLTKKRLRKVTLHCVNYNKETAHQAAQQGLGEEKEATFLERKLIEDIQQFKASGGMNHTPNKWEIALEKRKKERPVSACATTKTSKRNSVGIGEMSPINTKERPKSAGIARESPNLARMKSILSLFDDIKVSDPAGALPDATFPGTGAYSPLKFPDLPLSPVKPTATPKAYDSQHTAKLVAKVTELTHDSTAAKAPNAVLNLKSNASSNKFDDIVMHNDAVEEKFREDIPNFAFKRGRYGSYKSKDVFILVNLLHNLFKMNDATDTDSSALLFIDDSYVFPIDLLLSHPEIKSSHALVAAIEAQPVDYFDRSITKRTVIRVICPFATDAELSRICTYVRVCELFKWMLLSSSPPKKDRKNNVAKKGGLLNQSMNKVPVDKPVQDASGPVYIPGLPAQYFPGILADGFTNWTIKNHAYREFIQYIGKWKRDKCGTITCQDMLDIICALLPSKFSSSCKHVYMLAQKLKALYDLNDEIDENMMSNLLKNLMGFVVVVDAEKRHK